MHKSILYRLRHLLDLPTTTSAATSNQPQPATSQSLEDPVSDAELPSQQLGALAALPNELLIHIYSYLTIDAQACLALANRHLKHIIGPECWYRLEVAKVKARKLSFLCQIGRDSPDCIPCSKCTAFHRRELSLGEKLQKVAQKRVCDQAFGRVAICTPDSIGMARLRAIIKGTGTSATQGVSLTSDGSCQISYKSKGQADISNSMVIVQGSVILPTRFLFAGDVMSHYGTLSGCEGLLCPPNDIADFSLYQFCACRRVHTRSQACSNCPYPACCMTCATEIDRAIETVNERLCLVITTWRRLGNGQDTLVDWRSQCRQAYSGFDSGSKNYRAEWRTSTCISEDFALGWHLRSLREQGFNITE